MSKILKNQLGSPLAISDTGVTLPASPATYVIQVQDYLLWAASSDVVTAIGSGDVIVNDGSFDLSISDGIDLIKDIFPSSINVFGQVDDIGTVSGAEDSFNALRITSQRGLHVNLRTVSGAEFGTGALPVRIDPTGTTTQPISATSLPLPTGAATAANQATEIASLASIDAGIPAALGQTTMANSMPVVFANDQTPILVTASSNSDFTFGDITLAAIAIAVVRRTAYIEQTSNAQRSIVSASASDAAAGTGARTVRITYFTATWTGPFFETVTLNGTTPVNTVATDICYIESMEVLTVGSGLTNAGIISLKAAVAGGGATIGTIALGNNQTLWAHHYVATGKVCNVTGISVSHNGTTVGSGGVFILRAQALNVVNSADFQVSDFVRLYGQSSTFARVYTSAIKIPGPARLAVWVTPETASSTVYRASIDFFEP